MTATATKSTAAASWTPKTFVPTKRQYEKGVRFTPPSTGIPIWITKEGYKPTTPEDEAKLLSIMEHDKFCGVCLFGKQEMSTGERTAVNMALEANSRIAAQDAEIENLREELRVAKIAGRTSGRE
jgi:hypothetical protein